MWILEAESGSSARKVSVPEHWIFSPTYRWQFLNFEWKKCESFCCHCISWLKDPKIWLLLSKTWLCNTSVLEASLIRNNPWQWGGKQKKRKRIKKTEEKVESKGTWGHLYDSMEIVILATLWKVRIKWTPIALTFVHIYSLILAIIIFLQL